ncbi:MAG: hemolysin family protein [Bacteroidales bacterium]|nr:hemolysin family protein [Bacteroidales bacterium]
MLFFAAAKAAFLSSNKLLFELEKQKQDLTARVLNLFYQHPSQYISTIQIGKILSLVTYAFFAMGLLSPLLEVYIGSSVLILVLTILISAVVLLFFGEFLPQTLAIIRPKIFLSIAAFPLYIFYILFYPFSKLITAIGCFFLRLFGVKSSLSDSVTFGRDDLDQFIQKTIDEAPEDTELEKEVRLFQNAMEFSNVKIKDCVVPRTEIVAVEKSTSIQELIDLFVKTGLSKILVYQEDIDNVIGYIHSSELFSKPVDWTQSIYTLPFVPENMAASKLMENMLAEKKSIAVVVDEYGGTAGVITLEDLVEEIFGEIEDEHDTQLLLSRQIGENEFVFSGRLEIDRINEEFDLDIPESDDYMTIAGYILHSFQDFPKVNETIRIDSFEITILKVTHTKIELVKLKRLND